MTPTIKVYDPMITWYRCGQSTFSSCHHMAAQRKAKMNKSTTGQKPQRIKIKVDKSNKTENNLILQQLNCTIPFLFMRSHCTGVHNPNFVHMIKWWDREKPNGQKHHRTKAPRIKINADKSPANPKNILILHKSRCTIPFLFMWSRDTGVHIPHSVNMIMWWDSVP